MKTGIMGTHGAGKTTLALKLAADFKTQFPGENVGLLMEVARSCPFALNLNTTVEAQMWIYHAQIKAELELSSRHDTLFCDRTILDTLVYSESAGFNEIVADYFFSALDWLLTTYDTIYWVRPGPAPVDDGFRNPDRGWQIQIDDIFDRWVAEYRIPAIIVGQKPL